jgi:Zn finger protein HypA/HybF involved in hydrogenase expression
MWYHIFAAGFFVSLIAVSSSAAAEELNCPTCHAKLIKEKLKHAAVDMGCPTCHTGITASNGRVHKWMPSPARAGIFGT